jgi:hypothetical protein
MKTGYLVCDQCKKTINYPALFDVSLSARFNVGTHSDEGRRSRDQPNPGIIKGIMGCVEIHIAEVDFCDVECLYSYLYEKAQERNSGVGNVPQYIYVRDEDSFTPGKFKNGTEVE